MTAAAGFSSWPAVVFCAGLPFAFVPVFFAGDEADEAAEEATPEAEFGLFGHSCVVSP